MQPRPVRIGPLRHNIDTKASHTVPSLAGATCYLSPFTSDLLPCLLPISRS